MNVKKHLLLLAIILWGGTIFCDVLNAQQLNRYAFEEGHMGTLFTLIFYAPDDSTAELAAKGAFEHVEKLNSILSDYDPDSNLNQLSSQSGSKKLIPIAPTLFTVLKKAQEVARETNGAFDITIGPFVKLWRKIRRMEEPELPSQQAIEKLSEGVGYEYIKVDSTCTSVALTQSNMQLDLGGIAKGYTTDEVLRILRKHNIHSALVDAGGDIRVGDSPPEKDGWTISIPIHTEEGESDHLTLQLSNKAIATSGGLFQHVYIDGQRYSHIIDPRTGMGLTTQSMVTVIAPDGITADSYASAISVLNPDDGVPFLESKEAVEGRIEYQAKKGIKINQSATFDRLVIDSK